MWVPSPSIFLLRRLVWRDFCSLYLGWLLKFHQSGQKVQELKEISTHSVYNKTQSSLFLPHRGLWVLLHSSWVWTYLHSVYPVFCKATKKQELCFFISLGTLILRSCVLYPSTCTYESACSTRSLCAAVAVYEKTSKEWTISLQKDVVKVMSLKTDISWGWLKDFYLKKSIRYFIIRLILILVLIASPWKTNKAVQTYSVHWQIWQAGISSALLPVCYFCHREHELIWWLVYHSLCLRFQVWVLLRRKYTNSPLQALVCRQEATARHGFYSRTKNSLKIQISLSFLWLLSLFLHL